MKLKLMVFSMLFSLTSMAAQASFIIMKVGYVPGMAQSYEIQHGITEATVEAMKECKSEGGVLTKIKNVVDQNAVVAGLCVLKSN